MLILFEGVDGGGKTTQAENLAAFFRTHGRDNVVLTNEPGGCEVGMRIKALLKECGNLHPEAEFMLFMAARSQHVHQVIQPALAAGNIVICDRFSLSTHVFQGMIDRAAPLEVVNDLNEMVTEGIAPTVTFIMDCPASVVVQRLSRKGSDSRYDLRPESFHQEVREAYLSLANPAKGVFVVDGNRPSGDAFKDVVRDIKWYCQKRKLPLAQWFASVAAAQEAS